jgi:class 3 adenylate cyclase
LKNVATPLVKYVFLDIVGFTRNRSVEAQSDIVDALNAIVSSGLSKHEISTDDRLLLPTGDGICVAIIRDHGRYDLHVALALTILELVSAHNAATKDESRHLQVRVGVNENVDNLVTDINGNTNVAGAGVSMAQRIMDLADGGQVIVGQTVFDKLNVREKYMNLFRQYEATVKHGTRFKVFQYIGKTHVGLDIKEPSALKPRQRQDPRLDSFMAYYFAEAYSQAQYIKTALKDGEVAAAYAITAWLYLRAYDASELAAQTDYEKHEPWTWGYETASMQDQIKYYNKIEFALMCKLALLINEHVLAPYAAHLAGPVAGGLMFVKDSGIEKLRAEWPKICLAYRI